MYSDVIRTNIVNDLESQITNIVEATITLASQGYTINSDKKIKLQWLNILNHAFENINVFEPKQQDKLEIIYNKLFTL